MIMSKENKAFKQLAKIKGEDKNVVRAVKGIRVSLADFEDRSTGEGWEYHLSKKGNFQIKPLSKMIQNIKSDKQLLKQFKLIHDDNELHCNFVPVQGILCDSNGKVLIIQNNKRMKQDDSENPVATNPKTHAEHIIVDKMIKMGISKRKDLVLTITIPPCPACSNYIKEHTNIKVVNYFFENPTKVDKKNYKNKELIDTKKINFNQEDTIVLLKNSFIKYIVKRAWYKEDKTKFEIEMRKNIDK